jgi:hypothetical protein
MKNIELATSYAKAPAANLNLIAAKVIQWQRRQTEAFNRYPLAYVKCLLDQLAERGDVPMGDIEGEIGALLPELEDEECDRLVSLYMRGELKGD